MPFVPTRCVWEVLAGVVPSLPMPEFTRRFTFTANDPDERFLAAKAEAYAYAESLTDPSKLNWVRVDWVWF
jgi:hypothetical protein